MGQATRKRSSTMGTEAALFGISLVLMLAELVRRMGK